MSKPLKDDAVTARFVTEQAKDPGSWGAMVSSTLLALDMQTDHPESFTARMRNRVQGGIHLAEIEASGHAARRGAERVGADGGSLVLCHVLSGEGYIVQDGRQAQLGPGDFGFYQTGRPVEVVVPTGFNILFLKFPQSLITLSSLQIAELVAERLDSRSGLAPALAGLLGGLNSVVDNLTPELQMLTLHNAVDLTSTMMGHELALADSPEPAGQKRVRFEGIAAYIDAHLHDPDISPRSIAAANFISVRYLHAIFSESGETVGSWMRTRRLDRCARDLRDPRLAGVPVSVLSHRNGFKNQSYFSQLFKEATGQAPAEYRAAALARA
ncbi:helix-turn-helix domain-containing protein [Arthrobacter sp. PAMC25564]|uniref:AraC-like ligand-binding domain-containing protein n=1 Tax=Arthrobacter sp. PAMC25564 TaxID=2565366 RepID=UPI0010A240BE|nr:helix-turn-helix domain-containing protein [Arthrobacter sp. PAMC25564]QCB97877.1 helix-turn-helix domain-containing protein [Arthrobacter sp. PAMC25564]